MVWKMMEVKPKTARAVHANRGIEAAYRKALRALIADMHGSIEYWVTAAYRKHPPRMNALIAQDASPADAMYKILKQLARRWADKFDLLATKMAERFVGKMFKTTDASFQQALKNAGWTVDFKMTPAIRDAFNASLNENVGLIKSIPRQYLGQVEGIVMRSYSAGRDLQALNQELKELYPKASHRAELISRDQSNKANAIVNKTRQLELGLTDAIWMHSSAGKEPRPDHVAANGKQYKIADGCKISGEFIYPGEEINCRCTSRVILPR